MPIKKNKNIETSTIEADVIAETKEIAEKVSHFRRTFSSLYYRNYLYFSIGAGISNMGTWLQTIALSWLVLQMTNSSLYLGLINFASFIPVFLFSFIAGIYADRVNKKQLIIYTQIISMIFAFILGILVHKNIHTVFSIIFLAFLAGIAFAFVFPAWQAFISELVPKQELLNAIALNSAQFHAARLVGPTIAGLIIATLGTAACFYLNSISFLTVVIALLLIKHQFAPRQSKQSGWKEFREGFHYILNNRLVLYLLLGVGVVSIFGLSTYTTLMPVFARDILRGDAKTLGFLMGANGLGALLGALTVAYISHFAKPSGIIKYGMFVFSLSVFLFAFSKNLLLSLALLVIVGFAFLAVVSTLNTSIQSIVPQRIRGRIMSFFVWMFLGQMPLGGLLVGALAEKMGAPLAVALDSLIPFFLSLYLFFSFPSRKIA